MGSFEGLAVKAGSLDGLFDGLGLMREADGDSVTGALLGLAEGDSVTGALLGLADGESVTGAILVVVPVTDLIFVGSTTTIVGLLVGVPVTTEAAHSFFTLSRHI